MIESTAMELFLTYIIAPVLTLLLGWVIGNRKSVAEVRNLELDATQKAIAIWKDLANTIETELKEVNQERKREVAELKQEIAKLRIVVNELKSENTQLKEYIDKIKKFK
jgi:septal ring factor EnvC (AmiA/AmiB activator)